MQGTKRVQIGRAAHIIDRDARNQLRSSIPRSSVGIDDGRALSGKIPQDARLDRLDYRSHSLGIIVRGQTHQDVHFADVDQLAKEIIRKKTIFCQSFLRAQRYRALFDRHPLRHRFHYLLVFQIRLSRNQ